MTSQTMLAGMKFSITGIQNSHDYFLYGEIGLFDTLIKHQHIDNFYRAHQETVPLTAMLKFYGSQNFWDI